MTVMLLVEYGTTIEVKIVIVSNIVQRKEVTDATLEPEKVGTDESKKLDKSRR